MPADAAKTIECICDACGSRGKAIVLFGAVSPPSGWFVHGRVALDHIVGAVEQWFYCSERCARKQLKPDDAELTAANDSR